VTLPILLLAPDTTCVSAFADELPTATAVASAEFVMPPPRTSLEADELLPPTATEVTSDCVLPELLTAAEVELFWATDVVVLFTFVPKLMALAELLSSAAQVAP
jgi:hypothetical protein